MATIQMSGVRAGVGSIIEAFAEGSKLFQSWREEKSSRKHMGQAELETSLFEGDTVLQKKCEFEYFRFEGRFDIGDSK